MNSIRRELMVKRYEFEALAKWRELTFEMPFFSVPDGYQIAVTPPFAGADARFRIKRPDGVIISVYADFYNNLGTCEGPYWEVHPYMEHTGRCDINDTETLWKMIKGEPE